MVKEEEIPVAEKLMHADDEVLFLRRHASSFDVWS